MELLQQRVHYANELPSLGQAVLPHGVVVLQDVTQVLDLIHPRQGVSIQHDRVDILPSILHLGEDETLGVNICNKLELMVLANCSQMATIACSPDLLSDIRRRSSAYPRTPY